MSWEICGPSALRLHRTPPQVTFMLPSLPPLEYRSQRATLPQNATYQEVFRGPLHVLVDDCSLRNGSRNLITHVWKGDLPSQAFWNDEDLNATFTSPLFTLLTLAPLVSTIHLAMAAFEFCGAFSIFKPSPTVQKELDLFTHQRLSWPHNWRQVKDHKGRPTSLWQRDPMIEIAELRAFVKRTKGTRGNRKLAQAAQMVTGICASPLEVQASILFGLSRRLGGEGFGPFSNNHRISLSPAAQKLAGQSTCYADLFFAANELHGDIDVELQGHLIHDGGTAGGLDANRTLGLQSMGIDVVLLTSEQLTDTRRFRETAAYLARRLGIARRPKTPAMLAREEALRHDLFIDWETLGSTPAGQIGHRPPR